MSIEKGLDTIKSALDTTKLLKSTRQGLKDSEVNMKLVELMELLVTAKEDFVEIKSKLLDKDKLIIELQDKLEKKDKVSFEDPFLWRFRENGEKEKTPYCPKCYHAYDKLIPLHSKPNRTQGSHQCTVCGSWYGKGVKREPRRAIRSSGWNI